MEKEEIIRLLKEDWNIQGFIATPLYLITCANSGLYMDKEIGVRYDSFIYYFEDDYADMYYNMNHLKKIWFKLHSDYKKDPKTFEKIRDNYNKRFAVFDTVLSKIEEMDITKLSEDEFIKMFCDVLQAQQDSVGAAHMIEAFSMLNDRKLRHLMKDLNIDKNLINRYAETLAQPIRNSWVTDNENELAAIIKARPEEQDEMLNKHAKKYFWVRNNYLHAKAIKAEEFKEELKKTKHFKKLDHEKIKQDKAQLIKKLKLDEEAKDLIHLIEFFADFQDERKRHILRTLYYTEMFAYECARRYHIKKENVKYLEQKEITKGFLSQENIDEILKERRKACLMISLPEENIVISGGDLKEYEKLLKPDQDKELEEFHGLSASAGTAIGRAVVCKNLESIKNVKEGDVLVAPMTRPDYVPAMKKACAIVTDEGGITCHAAIVSRELGIPCVIGTKNATKIIKTGDLVEVKGNHGLVVIIEHGENK